MSTHRNASHYDVSRDMHDAAHARDAAGDDYSPSHLERHVTFFDRFIRTEKEGDELLKKGRYAEAAKAYSKAVTIGQVSRVIGFLGATPSKDYVMTVKEKKAKALRKLGENSKGGSGLEKTSATLGILGILGAAFFLTGSLTGNVIGTFTEESSSMAGWILLAVGALGTFAYFRAR